jgi:hypothetical protein
MNAWSYYLIKTKYQIIKQNQRDNKMEAYSNTSNFHIKNQRDNNKSQIKILKAHNSPNPNSQFKILKSNSQFKILKSNFSKSQDSRPKGYITSTTQKRQNLNTNHLPADFIAKNS